MFLINLDLYVLWIRCVVVCNFGCSVIFNRNKFFIKDVYLIFFLIVLNEDFNEDYLVNDILNDFFVIYNHLFNYI